MLNGRQIAQLADALDREWNVNELALFASDYWEIKLDNLAPGAGLKELAVKLITKLNTGRPLRDRELLERLRDRGNAALRELANELLYPPFFSPTDDPHDAIVLGRAAFVDRKRLRENLREFTNPNDNSTRVLIIRGDEPCGKSYSWSFLRHLAMTSPAGATPMRVELGKSSFTPKELMEYIFSVLRLDHGVLPPMTDEPQLARIEPLIGSFLGQVVVMEKPYWLVIDDINDPKVTKAVRETVYAIACGVECSHPRNLWVALLGYNASITDNADLRWVAQDEAKFPDAALLAEHFKIMADVATPDKKLPLRRAREYADVLLSQFPELTKADMIELTSRIERLGDKLKAGERPKAGAPL